LATTWGPVRPPDHRRRPTGARCWWAPWLAVQRIGKTGSVFRRAWKLGKGQMLHTVDLLVEMSRAG
jgi:hypothetical protein